MTDSAEKVVSHTQRSQLLTSDYTISYDYMFSYPMIFEQPAPGIDFPILIYLNNFLYRVDWLWVWKMRLCRNLRVVHLILSIK